MVVVVGVIVVAAIIVRGGGERCVLVAVSIRSVCPSLCSVGGALLAFFGTDDKNVCVGKLSVDTAYLACPSSLINPKSDTLAAQHDLPT